MRSPAHSTALFLIEQGATGAFGGSADFSVYVSREPLEPANVVTIYDTGGGGVTLFDMRSPSIQVRVRATDYDAGWKKANAVFETLAAPFNIAVQDGVILTWDPSSDVAYIGRDDSDRVLLTCNFNLLRDGVAT